MLRSMLLVAFLFSTSWGFSQTETCNIGEFTPVCNELGVVIRSNCNNCDLGDASCRQLVFDVFLYTQNQMPSTGQPLCYQDLSVTINVVSDQSPSFSRINIARSEVCSATGFGSELLLHIDEEAGQAVWTNAGNTSHPSIMFYPGNQLCPLLGNSAAHLFSIVVDAMPGEAITVECADLIYTRPETGSADYDQDGILECADVKTGDEDPNNLFSTTILYCSPATNVSLPTPIDPHPDVTVSIEAPDLTGMPNDALVPITLSSGLTTGTLTFLDFVVRLTVDQLMTPPVFVAGDFTIETGFDEPIAVPNAIDPTINDYLFHVRFRDIELSDLPLGNDLFKIKVNAPVYMSEGGEVCFSGVTGMAETTEHCGRVVFDETNAECVDFGGDPVCNEGIQVTVQGVVPTNGQIADCKLQVFVSFDWTSQAQFIELHTFNFQLDFEAGSDIVLQSIDPNGAFDCPSSNNPAFCANCYFGTGTQSFVMCFKQGAPNGYLKINKGQDLVLLFDVPSNCIGDVVLRKAEFGLITYDMNDDPIFNDVCRLATPDPEAPLSSMQLTGFPLCVPLLTGEIKNYKSIPEAVEGVTVEVKRSNASQMCTMYPVTNCYGFSTCICGYDEHDVTPFKKDGVINGVSTYDLVLINKHILGIELFDSPYKIIAGNAFDLSGGQIGVTTLDIAEFRKLILGIYDDNTWPSGHYPSWRFVPAVYVFPNPDNPFTPQFPESILELDIQANSNNQANFVAVKTGDVNLSHIANNTCRPAAKTQYKPTGFAFKSNGLEKNNTITYAFAYDGNDPLTAFQGGIRYNPQLLEFIGASVGDVEGVTPDCFGLTRVDDGEIRLVWLSPDMESHFLQPGQVLCHFTFRVKGVLTPENQVLQFDDAVLEGEAISSNNEVFRPVGNPFTTKARNQLPLVSDVVRAEFVPNPLTGSGRIVIHSKEQSAARLMMFDAFGKRVGYREFHLVGGSQEILLPETGQWPSGMYSWLLLIGSNRVAEGKVVKP